MFDIPIITYHKISNKKEFGLTTVSKTQFDYQMRFLSSKGYKTICFKDLTSKKELPEKPIIITFDDGYENVYHNATPIMEKYGYKAVIFVVTDYLGKYNLWEAVPFQQRFKHLSKDQILKMREQDHEIASHGKMHQYLPFLNQLALYEEIKGSKVFLEQILKEKIISFCYPYGRYSEETVKIVKEAGYKYATSNVKIDNGGYNPFSLKRRSIYSTDSLRAFKTKTSSNTSINFTVLSEILIQKGALASIGINMIRQSIYHF
jgi:peptidoglycan/xylan/chitin deacetylase (PgdA/CDA1 family)